MAEDIFTLLSLPVPAAGFEPLTIGLSAECFTTMLPRLAEDIFTLLYQPVPTTGFKPLILGL